MLSNFVLERVLSQGGGRFPIGKPPHRVSPPGALSCNWIKQDVINSRHITWLLTLHNLPSPAAAATKDDYVLLAVHDHRCVIIPRLAEKKYVFWAMMMLYNCFQLHNIFLKALLSGVFVMKTHNLTSKYGSPPSRRGLSSTICTIFWSRCSNHRTPQGCLWSQRGSGQVSLWQQLQWEEEQDESLPGEGKGGIVQLAGKTSTSVSVWAPYPPVIIRPAQWKI